MRRFFLLLVIICSGLSTYAQDNFGIKLEPLGIPFGVFQINSELTINERFSTGAELTLMNQEASFIIDDHWVGEGLGLFGRYYFAQESPDGNFLQLYLRYFENNYIETGERRGKDDNIIAADIGFGRQIRWNSVSFDPYIGVGALGYKSYDIDDDPRELSPFAIVSFDLGYWF